MLIAFSLLEQSEGGKTESTVALKLHYSYSYLTQYTRNGLLYTIATDQVDNRCTPI